MHLSRSACQLSGPASDDPGSGPERWATDGSVARAHLWRGRSKGVCHTSCIGRFTGLPSAVTRRYSPTRAVCPALAVLLALVAAGNAMAAEPTTLLSELPAMEQEAAARKPARAKCANCQRPVAVCLCGVLPTPKVSCATRCLVLQHPEEAGKSTGTVGLLQLSLESCTVIVGKKFRGDDLPEEVRAAAAQPGCEPSDPCV
jgi:hypothetical protein